MNALTFFEKIKPVVTKKPAIPENGSLVKAAVLVAVLVDGDKTSFGLIKRTESTPNHAGQISFPGGHMEPFETPVQTALRETEEEIGVAGSVIEVAGYMEPVATFATGYLVWPVVGILNQPPVTSLDPREVDDFFWVPVELFSDENNYTQRNKILTGEKKPRRAVKFSDHEIWGVTLRIIESLVGPAR